MKRILIIGGYGNFGQYITKELSKEKDLKIIIAGRNLTKAKALANSLLSHNSVDAIYLDIFKNLIDVLKDINPDIVIHTSGPYQSQSYFVANACIQHQCHYIDLADAREFVVNIKTLHQQAKSNNVLVVSGASSVPTLSSAIIDHYINEFMHLTEIDYAISSAQRTNQGLATTNAILSYVGKPFKTLTHTKMMDIYGWQDLRMKKFWGLNTRCLGNCNIPDLDLFPSRYPQLKHLRFQAGIESKVQHLGLFLLSFLVRFKLIHSLQPAGKFFLKISRLFDPIGSNDSGFYMTLKGVNSNNKNKKITFELIGRSGDGLYIPCIPAIIIAKKLARNKIQYKGATSCMGFISLEEYLQSLHFLKIQHRVIIE